MPEGELRTIKFNNDTAFGLFTWTGVWVGTIQRLSPGRGCIRFYACAALPAKDIVGYIKDGVYYWDSYALKSKTPVVYKGNFTISGGVTEYSNQFIKLDSVVFVQIVRNDDGLWGGYFAYPRVNEAGKVAIYIRQPNGSTFPADNSMFTLNILVFNT